MSLSRAGMAAGAPAGPVAHRAWKAVRGPMAMERDTVQRRAIRDVFERSRRPLSPKEVLEGAQAAVPSLGIATVYRTVKALIEGGWLVPVELPGEPPRYEVSGKKHHHHFVCDTCDRVFEVDGCPGNLSSVVPAGFQMARHEVVLYGMCAACAA
jgi:Fur family ferric uptake transcriptional regulator